jgi:hypothetical protein
VQTRITQRTLVQCPVGQADLRVADFFRAHSTTDGGESQLSLWVDAGLARLPVPVRLTRSVTVSITPAHRVGEMAPSYHVTWAPAQRGPFPLFDGSLCVEGTDNYDAFYLVLEGSYQPPLGIVGAAFDVILGARIASLCTRNLLALIAEEIEAAYAVDEAAKPVAAG